MDDDRCSSVDACCATEKIDADVRNGHELASDCCSAEDKVSKGDATEPKQKTCPPPLTACLSASAEHESRCSESCCGKNDVSVTGLPSDDCVNDCCEAPYDHPSSSLPSYLRIAMAKYENMLKQGQCLCREALDQLGFVCCDPFPAGLTCTKTVSSRSTKKCGNSSVASTKKETHPRRACNVANTERVAPASTEKRLKQTDIEQSSAREHVVLSVSGMTCTGCSKKMMNTLVHIAGLSNPQVIFVSGSTEFDLDSSVAGKVDDILIRLEKETGFKCSRIVSEYQDLIAFMSAPTAKRLENASLAGLISVTAQKNKTYRITYNPRIIGARSILPQDSQIAPPEKNAASSEGKRYLVSTTLTTALAAAFTIPVLVLEWSHDSIPRVTRSTVTLVLATLVQALAIREFYIGAVKSLVYSRVIEMDMLVVISITAAYVYSVAAFGLTEAGIKLEQGPIFETSTLLITLILLGRLIAAWARMRAVSAVSLRSLQVETALLLLPPGETTKLDARLLEFGDTIMVPPHSRIVTDGDVVSGNSAVDESMVTGESTPVSKQTASPVIAGTLNGDGTLHVRLTRLPGDNSISDIATLVENAVAAKPRIQEVADQAASWFVPVVVGLAMVVFCIWTAVAIQIRHRNGGGAVGVAVTYTVAVLAVSCPCALGLAVPMVLVIAGGVSARAGVIIKAANAIEQAHQVTDVVFDKTGTLTEGDLQVVHQTVLPTSTLSEETILSLSKAIVEGNEHPVSAAIALHLADVISSGTILENIMSIPGVGLSAQYARTTTVKAGNPYWLNLSTHPDVLQLFEQAMTVFCMTVDDQPILVHGLKSTIRPNAAATIAELHRRGLTCHMVSGDNSSVVSDVARTLAIPAIHLLASSSPAEKQQFVQNLQTSPNGRKQRKVLFVGDGTNDAVAIAQADVGVQMGSASDVTSAVADVVLLSKKLDSLLMLLDLSSAAVARIRFNFVWSAVYNFFAILLASGAFIKVRIPAAYAGLGEVVSVGPVVLAAVTLMWQ